MVQTITKNVHDSMRKDLLLDHYNRNALMVRIKQCEMQLFIMVSEVINCEAMAEHIWHVLYHQEIHD